MQQTIFGFEAKTNENILFKYKSDARQLQAFISHFQQNS